MFIVLIISARPIIWTSTNYLIRWTQANHLTDQLTTSNSRQGGSMGELSQALPCILSKAIKANWHRLHARHDTDRTVLSCLVWTESARPTDRCVLCLVCVVVCRAAQCDRWTHSDADGNDMNRQALWYFLLVVCSNNVSISHCFFDTTTFTLYVNAIFGKQNALVRRSIDTDTPDTIQPQSSLQDVLNC